VQVFNDTIVRVYGLRRACLSLEMIFGGLELLNIILAALDENLVVGVLKMVTQVLLYIEMWQ